MRYLFSLCRPTISVHAIRGHNAVAPLHKLYSRLTVLHGRNANLNMNKPTRQRLLDRLGEYCDIVKLKETTMKKLLIASALLSTVVLGPLAVAKSSNTDMRHHQIENVVRDLRGLSLTAEQRKDVKSLVSAFKQAHDKPVRTPMSASTFATASDETLNRFVEANLTTRSEHSYALAELRHNIYSLLTAEQQTELVSREANFTKKREKMKARDTTAKRSEKKGQRWAKRHDVFKDIDLSDEQRSELKTLRASFKQDMSAHRQAMKDVRHAQQQLIRSDEFSKSAWDALNSQYQDTLIGAGLNKAKQKQSMLMVLTEAQRLALDNKRTERRALRDLM